MTEEGKQEVLKKKIIVDQNTKVIFLLVWRGKWAQIDYILDGKKFERPEGDISTIAPYSGREWIKEYFIFIATSVFRELGITNPETYSKDLYEKSTSSGGIFPEDVLAGITQIMNYGPVEGMDITYKGRNFSLKGDDFLSAKGFKIWLLSEFGENLIIPISSNDPTWTGLVVTFQKLSTPKPVAQYDLASPVFDDLKLSIRRNKIYTTWDEEAFRNLAKAGVKNYFLIDGVFYIHRKIFQEMIEHHELTRRKMRQYFEPYLIDSKSKLIHRGSEVEGFWCLNWNKLAADLPELQQVMIDQHIQPDFDVRCVTCKATFLFIRDGDKDKFIDDHIAQHALKEPDDPKEYAKFLEDNFEFFDPNKLVVKKEAQK